MNDPYRDDRDALRAEVERLRGELQTARRRPRLAWPLGLVALHVMLRLVFESHLNAREDGTFVLAIVGTYLPLVAAIVMAIRAVVRPKG